MENRKMENRKYALYTFLTLMSELSIASLMDMLLSKFESFYSAAAYVPMSDKLWHYGILKVICVTAALFLYFIIKCYYKGGETHEESDTQKKLSRARPRPSNNYIQKNNKRLRVAEPFICTNSLLRWAYPSRDGRCAAGDGTFRPAEP